MNNERHPASSGLPRMARTNAEIRVLWVSATLATDTSSATPSVSA